MGLKFQTLHGVVFSNAPLHGVKKAHTYANPFFILSRNPTPQTAKKPITTPTSSNEPKHFLNKAMNNKPNEPRMP